MTIRSAVRTPAAPTVSKLVPEDPLYKRAEEIHKLIARRAFELFASGLTNGNDLADWFLAEAQVLQSVPLEIYETNKNITVRAAIPGSHIADLELHVGPRCLILTSERGRSFAQQGEQAEQCSKPIFRVLDLPAEIEPDRVKGAFSGSRLEITLSKIAHNAKKFRVAGEAA